jgi:hypothetical protein
MEIIGGIIGGLTLGAIVGHPVPVTYTHVIAAALSVSTARVGALRRHHGEQGGERQESCDDKLHL